MNAVVENLRATANWCMVEGHGDDATHQALQAAIAEIERLQQELGECKIGYDAGTRAVTENARLIEALERLRELADSEGTRAVKYLRRARAADALLRQALEALEHHREQTRPIQQTDAAIATLRERLGPNV